MTEKSVSGVTAWSRLYEEQLGALRVSIDGDEIALETAMARLFDPDRDVRRTTAEAITEALGPGLRTRTFVFNTILRRQVDRRPTARLPDLDLVAQPRQRDDRRGRPGADRGDHVPLRRPAALLPAQGAPAGPRPARATTTASRRSRVTRTSGRGTRRAASSSMPTRDFSEEAGAIVARFFDDQWIDAPVRDDKRTGAFCATTVPGIHPYILLNYTGDRRSILTLAHELGHGLHGVLAQPLGSLQLVDAADDRGDRLGVRRGAHVRAAPRRGGRPAEPARPARRAHRGCDRDDVPADRDEPLRARRTHRAAHRRRARAGAHRRAVARGARRRSSGTRCRLEGYGPWWSYIPHFTGAPGYVYAYAYGYLFSLAIYRQYVREGDAMVEPYLELLRAGGSRSPEELARIVGLDLTDPGDLGERHRCALRGARRGGAPRGRDRARLANRRSAQSSERLANG